MQDGPSDLIGDLTHQGLVMKLPVEKVVSAEHGSDGLIPDNLQLGWKISVDGTFLGHRPPLRHSSRDSSEVSDEPRRQGMDSARLSARAKQPGHDRTFVTSETHFVTAARHCLDPALYDVADHPRDLAAIFPASLIGDRDLGVVPEASVTSKRTERKFFIEVKKQGRGGNAEERAYKHHTVQFYKTMHAIYGYEYHPFVTVCCESLATLPRYTRKAEFLFEKDQYFNWADYDLESLCEYLRARCAAWLD